MNNTQVVFVTGGSRGIGKAMITKFKSQNWRVATCATTQAKAELSGADLSMECDVGDVKQVRTTIEAIIKKFGRLDAVINNAGIAGETSLDPNKNDDAWHQIINVNLNGTYYVCKYSLPYLPNNTGRIVNISSVLGLMGAAERGAYCASKFGVEGLTRALAHDVSKRHITVNTICPGWVRTEMAIHRIKGIGISEEEALSRVPLKRFVEPEEVADLAYFLVASPGANNITGQALTIDGGVMA